MQAAQTTDEPTKIVIEPKDDVYIRIDLAATTSGDTAYYRLDSHFVEFLNKIMNSGRPIEAITLERKEGGSYGFNIGFVLGKAAN